MIIGLLKLYCFGVRIGEHRGATRKKGIVAAVPPAVRWPPPLSFRDF